MPLRKKIYLMVHGTMNRFFRLSLIVGILVILVQHTYGVTPKFIQSRFPFFFDIGTMFDTTYAKKKILVFGDSITDTKSGKTSWVQPAMAALGNNSWINFADGGAAFRQRSIKGVDDMPTQLEQAADQQDVDIVIVALGTNEYHNNPAAPVPSSNNPIVGSFDEAMAKDISDLSIEDTMYDAIRYAFYTIQQRWNCKAYIILPIQRAAWNWKHIEVLYTALEEMAIAYGFEVIDGRKCGIIADFEKKGEEGRDLKDGLHPKNLAAKEKIAKMVVAKIKETLVDL